MLTPIANLPVHLITGFLGSGKSTLIHRLIEQKPPGERWAVLINEFGQVGIDQAMFAERDDLVVKGLPGGCLCCQLAFVMQATLVNLLHRHRPDRLIIEPSGLGHPAGLLEVLRGEAFAGVLEVRDIIAVLDPRRLDDPRAREHETFRDQLEMADAVALTMTDLATPEQLAAAEALLGESWPAKKWVRPAPHGELPLSLLIEAAGGEPPHRASPDSEAHRRLREAAAGSLLLEDFGADEPTPGKPVREEGGSLGYATLGWRWHPDDVFDLDRVTALLGELPRGLRVKGVLHSEAGWKLYNRAAGAVSLTASAWRQDSRLEVIGEAGSLPQAEELETELQRCLCASRD
ncbi:CobW family GTP-binding protein [Halomonas sp. LBP4]|uniref:CobW family GTP-binding protein n=1 Tax=Halomonas sp. LBP4 TaxID=2044917 RepID=UPI000D761FAD|nr:GTP-binding protein [Halomonas sp. LBP4]PXX95273.1 GTP-binding protein [Halomonas sp. LBP4]